MAIAHMNGFDHFGTLTTSTNTRDALSPMGYTFRMTFETTSASFLQIASRGTSLVLKCYSSGTYVYQPGVTPPQDASALAFVGMQIGLYTVAAVGTSTLALYMTPLFEVRGFAVYHHAVENQIYVGPKPTAGNADPTAFTATGFYHVPNNTHFYDVEITGSSFNLYINNKLIGAYPFTVNTNPLVLCGGFGANSHPTATVEYDHLYLLTATGDDPKLRIGAQQIVTRVPDTLVSNDTWTISSGADAVAVVAKITPNDGTYMQSPVSPNDGKQVLYNSSSTAFPYSGTIRGVQYTYRLFKTDSGVRNATLMGGGKSAAQVGIGTTFTYRSLPVGGTWTVTKLLSDTFGVQVDA